MIMVIIVHFYRFMLYNFGVINMLYDSALAVFRF